MVSIAPFLILPLEINLAPRFRLDTWTHLSPIPVTNSRPQKRPYIEAPISSYSHNFDQLLLLHPSIWKKTKELTCFFLAEREQHLQMRTPPRYKLVGRRPCRIRNRRSRTSQKARNGAATSLEYPRHYTRLYRAALTVAIGRVGQIV